MNTIRFLIRALMWGVFLAILISAGVTYQSYQSVKDIVDSQFPELVRLVAEDNCLDNTITYNGVTIYQRYINQLRNVDNANNLLEFHTDAVEVDCYDRSQAPQKGSTIHVRLTGHFVMVFPLYQIPIDVPIVRELDVIGIRYYRDRE